MRDVWAGQGGQGSSSRSPRGREVNTGRIRRGLKRKLLAPQLGCPHPCRFISLLRHSLTHHRHEWQPYFEVAHGVMEPFALAMDAALWRDRSPAGELGDANGNSPSSSSSSSSSGGGGGSSSGTSMPAILPAQPLGSAAASSGAPMPPLHRGADGRGRLKPKPFCPGFCAPGGQLAVPAARGKLGVAHRFR